MKMLLLCILLLGGCATKMFLLPPLAMQPLQAQFGIIFRYADMPIPLQGAVEMTENEGSLGIIFPHGRTLGVCRYQGGSMECTPGGKEGLATRFMLRQIGLAVYRMLPALARESTRNSLEDTPQADWTVRWKKTDSGQRAEYQDLTSQVAIDMHFTEITRP